MADDSSEFRKTDLLRSYGPGLVFVASLMLLIAHSLDPTSVHIDFWTIGLLAFLIIVPFSSDVKQLVIGPDRISVTKSARELKEQVESTRRETIDKLHERVRELEKSDSTGQVDKEIDESIDKVRSDVQELVQNEHYQAAFLELVRLIERELRNALEEEGVSELNNAGLGEMVGLAKEYEAIDKSLIAHLEDIRPIRNQVAHGRKVNIEDLEDVIELAVDLYEALLYERETYDITEMAILEKIERSPELLELELVSLQKEVKSEFGTIDLLGEDSEGNKVIIEVKSGQADENHLKQLMGFLETQKTEHKDVRGILVAPSIDPHLESLTDESIRLREIDPREI